MNTAIFSDPPLLFSSFKKKFLLFFPLISPNVRFMIHSVTVGSTFDCRLRFFLFFVFVLWSGREKFSFLIKGNEKWRGQAKVWTPRNREIRKNVCARFHISGRAAARRNNFLRSRVANSACSRNCNFENFPNNSFFSVHSFLLDDDNNCFSLSLSQLLCLFVFSVASLTLC